MPLTIIGLGKTGKALAHYFAQQGEEVWAVDDLSESQLEKADLREPVSRWFLGGQLPDFRQVTRCFASPGIPPHHPAVRAAEAAGLKVEEELDLAYSLCQGKIIAVTGTNGKSTTTALIGEMLKTAGCSVQVGGNFGTPFLELVNLEKLNNKTSTGRPMGLPVDSKGGHTGPPLPSSEDTIEEIEKDRELYYVIEVSSFQLFRTQSFHPHVAVLLNITEDHLAWHQSFAEYLQAKAKLFACQRPEDFAVFNLNDLNVLKAVENIPAKKIPFSNSQRVAGAYVQEKKICWAPEEKILGEWELTDCSLTGIHNLENLTAAIAAAKILAVPDAAIEQTLSHFTGLPHRLQQVAKIKDVTYYDDSKATNVGAVAMSLASFEKDVILILGGVDKGGDYGPLKALVKAKAKALLLIGEAQEKIAQALANSTEIFCLKNMEEAVAKAHQLAKPGTTVLLSPACSSFDQYKNYHERGEHFQKLVKEIGRGGPACPP